MRMIRAQQCLEHAIELADTVANIGHVMTSKSVREYGQRIKDILLELKEIEEACDKLSRINQGG